MTAITLSIVILICAGCFGSVTRSIGAKICWGATGWWAFLIILNRMRLSDLQLDWTITEQCAVSFVLFLPTAVFTFVSAILPSRGILLSNSLRSPKGIFDATYAQQIVWRILNLCILVLVVDLAIYGVPLFSLGLGEALLNETRLAARTPVLFNLANQMMLMGCILLAIAKFYYRSTHTKLYAYTAIYLLHAILMFGRGSVVYLFVAIFLSWFLFSHLKFSRKLMFMLLPIFLFLIAFDFTGAVRQKDELALFDIIAYGLFNRELWSPFAWFYGYVVISLDNLILCVRDFDAVGNVRFKSLENFSPAIYALFLGDDSLASITEIQEMPYVGRFNLVTAFGFFGYDFGWIGVYSFASLILLTCLVTCRRRFGGISYINGGWLIFMIMVFVFLTVGNLIFNSKIVGILLMMTLVFLWIELRNRRRVMRLTELQT